MKITARLLKNCRLDICAAESKQFVDSGSFRVCRAWHSAQILGYCSSFDGADGHWSRRIGNILSATMKNRLKDLADHRLSLSEAMHLQAIEGNPLDAEQVAMFEMFDRQDWSDIRRRAYIRRPVPVSAARWPAN